MLYACDGDFWGSYPSALDFAGLKITQAADLAARDSRVRLVKIDGQENRIVTETPGLIGNGGNSGFQALNLAVQWGAMRVVLVGFDMTVARGKHYHADHPHRNPQKDTCDAWRASFEAAKADLDALGIEVVNATPGSALTCFPMMELEQALRWMQ